MCHVSTTGKQVVQMNTLCGCGCTCPVALPIDDEIRRLEDHKKILQDRIEIISKKITGLKTVNEP
jgi:L-lactate utilization protein LutB